ncbi:stimulator of interferon genes protein [Emydura macquarii macquarii]|uniref:stimulator of interferon genes protein n=1 Tax=Emydura macquarii macquarii TaxID=1129001 RepID=UPI003529E4AD
MFGCVCLRQMSHEMERPNIQTHPIIPKPREKRAHYMTCIFIAICIFVLYLLEQSWHHAAEYITVHFMALQIGALLRGVCNFMEEIWHVESRYRSSRWRVVKACLSPSLYRQPLLLVVCVCSYMALFRETWLPRFLNLTLICLCQLLNFAFGLQSPSAVEMSEICEKNNRNVAHGLAWSYYVGYLKLVLPCLKDSIRDFNRANNNLLKCKETWKLHILIPLSCEIHDDLKKADSNIQYWKDLPALQLDRAGTKRRIYKHSVYEILGEDKKLNYCIVEYATPLQSLYAMSQDESAAFSRDDRVEQAQLFCRTLGEILQSSKECAGCYRLIVYEESGDSDSHFLSKEILGHIRQQHLEEYTVCEGNQQSTTFLSTEPDILISDSELPRSLQSNGF